MDRTTTVCEVGGEVVVGGDGVGGTDEGGTSVGGTDVGGTCVGGTGVGGTSVDGTGVACDAAIVAIRDEAGVTGISSSLRL